MIMLRCRKLKCVAYGDANIIICVLRFWKIEILNDKCNVIFYYEHVHICIFDNTFIYHNFFANNVDGTRRITIIPGASSFSFHSHIKEVEEFMRM